MADEHLRIAQVRVRPSRQTEVQGAVGERVEAITLVDQFRKDIDFVLERAEHGALLSYGEQVLAQGIDLGILSVGALANDELGAGLRRAAGDGGSQVTIVPGAIGGIDAIAAAGPNALKAVIYTGSKAPRSWVGTPHRSQVRPVPHRPKNRDFFGFGEGSCPNVPQKCQCRRYSCLGGTWV